MRTMYYCISVLFLYNKLSLLIFGGEILDINKLSSSQVNRLISSLKKFEDGTSIAFPLLGKIKRDYRLDDEKYGIDYWFHIYRHPIEVGRFSLHIRFKENHYHLIRLDINNGTHRNPDGTIVVNNHIHIYDIRSEKRDEYAHSLPSEINNINDLSSALIDFF